MASAGANTYYARPVHLGNDREMSQTYQKHAMKEPKKTKHVTIITPKTNRGFDIENSSPPPRPPPPRPARVPKQPQSDKHSQERYPISASQNQATPEPKPLTRTNVTSHDRLWKGDHDNEDSGPTDVLSPPMKYITPETTEEMWRNFDPLDVIDSTSDHSDSSADTMIMMTTEEERSNKEKIDHSLKEYKSRKSKPDVPNTNKLKVNIQSKKNLQFQFSNKNGLINTHKPLTNGITYSESENVSKVTPLHVRTSNDSNGSSPESLTTKQNGQYSSPNDSPDDGYGTNSSSGTVSSPFSSSFNSDLDNSCNGSFKKVILPNGAIKPNSVRESWAVKRKQRMIDAEDNSVQEQLRELAIIEEEGSGNSPQSLRMQGNKILQQQKNQYGLNVARSGQNTLENKADPKPVLKTGSLPVSRSRSNRTAVQSGSHVVNVSQNDIERQNGQLYVIDSESDTLPHPLREEYSRAPPTFPPANEINDAPPVPPSYRDVVGANRVRESGDNSVYSSRNSERHRERTREARLSTNNYEGEYSSLPDNINSGPPMLKGGDQNYPTQIGSGKIYVSPNGDEGFYSLNRSSRSTSISSFQPLNEQVECEADTLHSPQSPLEALSGDLLEKWSDMDRNYRNYYGFNGETEKYSRTDSKVNYFQQKKINNLYGHDNYYRPEAYGEESTQGHGHVSGQSSANQGILRDSRKAGVSQPDSASGRTYSMRSHKSSKEGEKPKSKLFQILPNMFKPSSKKHHAETKLSKSKPKNGAVKTEPFVQHEPNTQMPTEAEQESEYMNIGEIHGYSMAHILQAEKLARGEFVSLENLQKRPVFASSKDIHNLFSIQNQSFDSIHHPGSQRHSFHAMPLSYRHVIGSMSEDDDMRPRAQSTSATLRSQSKTSVENRMALIARKNAMVMNQARQGEKLVAGSVGNLSMHSNSSNQQRLSSSRTRLDSGSSGGDSKLSTLV